MFLEVLKTIQIVRDKAVSSIQRIILIMFVPVDLDLFLLYMEDQNTPEFIWKKQRVRAGSILMSHINTT